MCIAPSQISTFYYFLFVTSWCVTSSSFPLTIHHQPLVLQPPFVVLTPLHFVPWSKHCIRFEEYITRPCTATPPFPCSFRVKPAKETEALCGIRCLAGIAMASCPLLLSRPSTPLDGWEGGGELLQSMDGPPESSAAPISPQHSPRSLPSARREATGWSPRLEVNSKRQTTIGSGSKRYFCTRLYIALRLFTFTLMFVVLRYFRTLSIVSPFLWIVPKPGVSHGRLVRAWGSGSGDL